MPTLGSWLQNFQNSMEIAGARAVLVFPVLVSYSVAGSPKNEHVLH
jgi:hypothetical protein